MDTHLRATFLSILKVKLQQPKTLRGANLKTSQFWPCIDVLVSLSLPPPTHPFLISLTFHSRDVIPATYLQFLLKSANWCFLINCGVVIPYGAKTFHPSLRNSWHLNPEKSGITLFVVCGHKFRLFKGPHLCLSPCLSTNDLVKREHYPRPPVVSWNKTRTGTEKS